MRDWICVILGAFNNNFPSPSALLGIFVRQPNRLFQSFLLYTRDNLDFLQSVADITSNIKQEDSGDYGLANTM